jgi:hypothetical protein
MISLCNFLIVPTTTAQPVQKLAFITNSQQVNESGLFTIKANGSQRHKRGMSSIRAENRVKRYYMSKTNIFRSLNPYFIVE